MIKNKIAKVIKWFIPSRKLRDKVDKIFPNTGLKKLLKLGLSDYQALLLNIFAEKYSLKDKIVLEIGSDLDLKTAIGMLELGAKEVYAVNPGFSDDLISPDKRIHTIKDLGENTKLSDNQFDIIFGIALLEHVDNPSSLAQECNRLLKQSGVCYLHGCPMWTSSAGHHCYIVIDGKLAITFFDERNPLKPWQHLVSDREQISQYLKEKNYNEDYINKVINWIYDANGVISRLTPTKIIEEFNPYCNLEVQRGFENVEENEFYEKALSQYSEEDLKTITLEFYITKN